MVKIGRRRNGTGRRNSGRDVGIRRTASGPNLSLGPRQATAPKRPVEPTVRHRTARIKYRREPEAVIGFALLGRAGRMFPDPTTEAEARHVLLPLGMATILPSPLPKLSSGHRFAMSRVSSTPEGRTLRIEVELKPEPEQVALSSRFVDLEGVRERPGG